MDDEILDPGTLRLLWSLGYAIPLVYAATGWSLRWWSGLPSEALPMAWVLGLWGVGALLTLAWAAAGRLRAPGVYLARWALAETVALVGLVGLAVGSSWVTFGVFLAWAAALHLVAAPPRPPVP